MATTRMTLGSLLGTVNTTANTITGVVDMVGEVVGMGTERVKHMATEQRANLALESAAMAQVALDNFAMRQTTHKEGVNKFIEQGGSNRAKLYDSAYASGVAALKDVFPNATILNQSQT